MSGNTHLPGHGAWIKHQMGQKLSIRDYETLLDGRQAVEQLDPLAKVDRQALLLEAVKDFPESDYIWASLALARLQRNERDEAGRAYQRSLELHLARIDSPEGFDLKWPSNPTETRFPEYQSVSEKLFEYLLKQGSFAECDQLQQKVEDTFRRNGRDDRIVRGFRGNAEFTVGRWKQARELLDEGIGNGTLDIYLHLPKVFMCHANLHDAVAMTALMEVYSTLPQWDSHRFLLMLLRVELEVDSFCHSKAVEIIQKLPQQRVASDTLLRATAASLTAWIATRGGSKGHENTHHVAERAEVLVDLAMATKLPDAIVAIWATQLRDTWKALNEDRWHHWDDVLKKLSPAPVEDARKAFSSN